MKPEATMVWSLCLLLTTAAPQVEAAEFVITITSRYNTQ